MKKLMFAFAAVAFATVANAATVAWNVTGISNSPDNAHIADVNGTAFAYLFAAASYDTVTAALNKGDLSVLSSGFDSSAATKAGRGSATATGETGDIVSAGNTYTGFFVFIDAATVDDAKNYAYTAQFTTAAAGDGGSVTPKVDFATTSATGGSGGWQAAAPIPEPTSGLLLLLGTAGLALRRRRA